ncbi:sporulation protein [Aquibacillus halophilus]|uniref:Sporulation protein n=1 Tax=Aquibacillus halophilus TaxID=930132 RepID=A0A6A8DRR4_9BACI|nr:sporulation protein [Aquibacillus halophilus]MRH43902.1 sporulation protein [Aquibacillus halophilus]
MIKKMICSLKICSPTIDLVLTNNEIVPGGNVSGTFHLQGGWIKQKVERLECDLVKEYPGKKTEYIEPVKTILMSKMIHSNDRREIPFTYQMPKDLHPSSTGVSYRFQTKIVYTDNMKSIDHDEIIVLPNDDTPKEPK